MDYLIYMIDENENGKFTIEDGCYSWIAPYYDDEDYQPNKRNAGDIESFDYESYFKEYSNSRAVIIEKYNPMTDDRDLYLFVKGGWSRYSLYRSREIVPGRYDYPTINQMNMRLRAFNSKMVGEELLPL